MNLRSVFILEKNVVQYPLSVLQEISYQMKYESRIML